MRPDQRAALNPVDAESGFDQSQIGCAQNKPPLHMGAACRLAAARAACTRRNRARIIISARR
jgi:hypothetical protein